MIIKIEFVVILLCLFTFLFKSQCSGTYIFEIKIMSSIIKVM